jgi:hypothetical protein
MYTAEISRTNPTAFVFLLDQSGSMGSNFGQDSTKSKAQFLADAINRLIQNITLRCVKGAEMRDYFFLQAIGYGSSVSTLLGNSTDLVPISQIAMNPLRVEQRMKKTDDGAGGIVEISTSFPIWIEPQANSGTPMCSALEKAYDLLTRFANQYPDSYPPTVLNLTDGESTDGSPQPWADKIKSIQMQDGDALIYNLHISGQNATPILFPSSDTVLPDQYAKLLFNCSSTLPPRALEFAQAEMGSQITTGARGFVFNADINAIVKFLDVGTRTASN